MRILQKSIRLKLLDILFIFLDGIPLKVMFKKKKTQLELNKKIFLTKKKNPRNNYILFTCNQIDLDNEY